VRPHDVTLAGGDHAAIRLSVEVVEAMGFEAYAHGRVGANPFVARLPAGQLPRGGDSLGFDVNASAVHLFDPDTGRGLA
jgi:ABC-type sugar transport system ATPase subunit